MIFCQAVTSYTEVFTEEEKSESLYLNVLCEFELIIEIEKLVHFLDPHGNQLCNTATNFFIAVMLHAVFVMQEH